MVNNLVYGEFSRLRDFFLSLPTVLKLVSVLTMGSFFSQIINFVSAPFITRIFSPDVFGLYDMFLSITNILSCFTALRFHNAILLPNPEEEKTSLFLLSMIIHFFLTSLLLVIVFSPLVRGLNFSKLNNGVLAASLWGFFLLGCYEILNTWILAHKGYSTMAIAMVSQRIFGNTFSIVLGLFQPQWVFLVVGHVIGQIVSILIMLRKQWPFGIIHSVNKKEELLRIAIRYKNFPLVHLWGVLMNRIGMQITPILLVAFFGSSVAGLFALSLRVVQLPVILFGNSIAQVFFQQGSIAFEKGTLNHFTWRAYSCLIQMSVFPMISVAILAPGLFAILFGAEWQPAGLYSRMLVPWLILAFCTSPLCNSLLIREKQHVYFFFQAFLLAGRIGVFFLWHKGNPDFAIAIFGIVSFFINLVFLLKILSCNGIPLKKAFTPLVKEFVFAILLLSPSIALDIFGEFFYFQLGWVLCAVLYFANSRRTSFIEIFKGKKDLNGNLK